jgi:hypothetical protein
VWIIDQVEGCIVEQIGPRRRWLVPVLVVGAVVVVAVLVLFQPWKLFVDRTVDEAAPASATTQGGTTAFESKDHTTTGQVLVLRGESGDIVRLEDLDTDNGPDLFVYLSPAGVEATGPALGEGALDLGELKGNVGDQNYAVPAGTDLADYRSVVIWCKRFATPFGAAPLPAAGS